MFSLHRRHRQQCHKHAANLQIYHVQRAGSFRSRPTIRARKIRIPTEPAEAIKFQYPDIVTMPKRCWFIRQAAIFIFCPNAVSGCGAVYKLKAGFRFEKTNTLEKISDFTVPAVPNGFLTGGAISPDGKRVVICDYFDAYEIVLPDKGERL